MTRTARLSERGDIRLGYRCNARCGFCYYQEKLDNPVEKEPTTAVLRKRIAALRAAGATEIEFTGGEPTIRSDLVELIRYAASLGFVNISMITNGLRLANARFAAAVIEAGVNDFLFSIHGHTSELHDLHTRIPGSFRQIMKAFENVKAHGVRVRSSTTVTGKNYLHVEAIVGKLIALGVEIMHLSVFSAVQDARGTDPDMHVRYSEAAAAIKYAIDVHEDQLPPLSVKYIPFCFMTGYEKYVMNLYQQSFDPDDWNYYLSNKIRRTGNKLERIAFDALALAGALLTKNKREPVRYGLKGLKVFGFTRIVELLRKKRLSVCRSCKFNVVCDGPWKSYVAKYGATEFVSVPGERIADPAWVYGLAHYRAPGVRIARRGAQTVALAPAALPRAAGASAAPDLAIAAAAAAT